MKGLVGRWVGPWLLLTGTFLLMVGSLSPWDVLWGGVVAAALLVWSGPWLSEGRPPGALSPARLWHFGVLVAWVLMDIVRGTWRMLGVILGPRPGANQGVVEVPLGERTAGGARVSALVASMSPGSVLLDIDWERRVMRFHMVDATRAEDFRRELEWFYRERQRSVFP
ncbi:Na+/H+ antiporter subunit E [Archangium primigenium]|uniref:Na+/H+ antiporter subunit E n=1 Tax=[Archangium] primigenium TaxID=2792470 RepID=UPI00195CBA0A|nr:Na+/H+ antiporter subunit E [Archangium primigenium]MBM7112594.1 Na+/H+ antiporter subunit E [Archangium primigenium]